MHHMDFMIVIKGILYTRGESINFPKVTAFEIFTGFWCGYGDIKQIALHQF